MNRLKKQLLKMIVFLGCVIINYHLLSVQYVSAAFIIVQTGIAAVTLYLVYDLLIKSREQKQKDERKE